MNARRSRLAVFVVLVVLYAAFALQRAFIIDDAYISFRYAKNLIDGAGLVYNPGQRVEGYSNLLWVLLTALGMEAHVPPEQAARALGILSGIVTLAVVWRLGRRLLPADSRSRWLALLPVALLVSNRSFLAWTTGGLETRFATMLLCFGIFGIAARAAPHWTGIPLALFVLTRADGFVLAVALVGATCLYRRTYGFRFSLGVAAWVCGAWGAQTLFRLAYYGQLLPNTFFVKVDGFPIRQGLTYLGLAALHYGIPLALALALANRVRRDGEPAPAPAGPLVAVVVAQLAYLACIGGDHFEFRFLDSVWPALAILPVAGVARARANPRHWLPFPVAASLLAVLVVWNAVPAFAGFKDQREIASVETEARFCSLWAPVGLWFRDHAGRDEVIALRPAGVIPYLSGLRAVDMLGLNDAVIARRASDPSVVVPGHRKLATNEDIVLRGGTTYILDHPNLHAAPPPLEPPKGLTLGGRRFAFIQTRAPIGTLWLRFWIVSEDAVVGDQIVPARVRSRITP